MQAARELPKCPEQKNLETFLDDWSGRTYTDIFDKKSVEKRFGLSRSSTLLHFLSGGRFPIYDSRVRTAIARLCTRSLPPNSVRWYLDSFLPLFSRLATACDTTNDLRALDKALFAYGSSNNLGS